MFYFQRLFALLFVVLLLTPGATGQEKPTSAPIWIPANLTEQEVAQGWLALFDGKTKYGWRAESDVNWKLKEGAITASSGKVGLLRTTSQFDNFVLRLEYFAGPKTNSGIFIRTSPRPKNPASDCYEINIAPADNPFPTGSIVARKKGKLATALDSSKWHSMEITANGENIAVLIDGKQTVSIEDRAPLGRGYIGLQFNEGSIQFRNIRLKPLGLQSLFNGKNLDGWKQYPTMKSKFTVKDSVMRVQNGSGQIETKNSYGDFVLQLQCKTNAPKLNSGLFFRCIPGQKMNGYESQIQNGFQKVRSRPDDCGTGGIFRRKNARIVNADDQKWFQKTIVAVGPHFAVWVNGLQVSDWTDQRKPNANPRRGLRLKPGTIMIQGHDPTTDLVFRNLYAKELDRRRPKK